MKSAISFMFGAFFLFGATALHAQAPMNDDLCDADTLVVGAVCSGANGDNTNATAQTGEPVPACFDGGANSVWYVFIAPASGLVDISTNTGFAGTNDDTEIALYSLPGGDCTDLTDLTLLDCHQDIDVNNFLSTILAAPVLPGQPYFVQVSGYSGTEGTFCIEVSEGSTNDSLCNAFPVQVDGPCTGGDNTGAGAELNEPVPFCFNGGTNSVWYTFRAPVSMGVDISVDTTGGGTLSDPEIAIYRLPNGDCTDLSDLSLVDCNQDSGPSNTLSELKNLVLNPGTDYFIQVSGANGAEGSFCLEVKRSPPANDDLCNADTLGVGDICTAFNGDNTAATSQPGEPVLSCFVGGANSVWYVFQAPASGFVNISTDSGLQGSNDDTEIALFALPGGDCTDLNDLDSIACNQDVAGFGFLSELLNVAVVPGAYYYVQVSGFLGTEGTFCIEVWEPLTMLNDDVCDAVPLILDAPCQLGDNTGATSEPNEPVPSCFNGGANSVWFSFEAPLSGQVTISTDISPAGTLADTELALYALPGGDCSDLSDLSLIDCNQDISGANLLSEIQNAPVTPGETYFVQVSGAGGLEGVFCIEVITSPPPNDDLCDAQTIIVDAPCLGPNGDNTRATEQPGEPMPTCFTGDTRSVWYKFTGPPSGLVSIHTNLFTNGTNGDTEIALYSLPGGDCTDLTNLVEIACNADVDFNNTLSVILNAPAFPGQEYFIQVSGFLDNQGTFCVEVKEDNQRYIYVDQDATGANSGTSWADAYTDLQSAISASIESDTILVAAGVYYPTQSLDRTIAFEPKCPIYGGFAGTESLVSDRLNDSISLHVVNKTILSGDIGVPGDFTDNSGCVIIYSTIDGLFLDGLTIADGYDVTGVLGGGISFISSFVSTFFDRLSIKNCVLFGNYGSTLAVEYGEVAIENSTFEGNFGNTIFTRVDNIMEVKDCRFVNNLSPQKGLVSLTGNREFTFEKCLFLFNYVDSSGAALYMRETNVRIDSCQFINNEAGLFGGAIHNDGADVQIGNCTFEGNLTLGQGGAIYSKLGVIALSHNDFLFNQSIQADGGGIFLDESISTLDSCNFIGSVAINGGGIFYNRGSLTARNCEFSGCEASLSGGGAYVNSNYLASFENCDFFGNQAFRRGGGIYSQGFLVAEKCRFQHNRTIESGTVDVSTGGGGIYATGFGQTALLGNCLFEQNIAEEQGGGVYVKEGAPVFRNCSFVKDSARFGGGGVRVQNADPTFSNCTFYQNEGFFGSAISLLEGTMGINYCTIYDNPSGDNNGIYLDRQINRPNVLNIRNSILAKTPILVPGFFVYEINSLGHNIFDFQDMFLDYNNDSTDIIGTPSNPLDPMLDTTSMFNGGFTHTLMPLPGSPALGRGEFIPLTRARADQRGFSRIIGTLSDSIDIGAFEAQHTFANPLKERALCLGDNDFATLPDIVLIDSTGGAFRPGNQVSLAFTLPAGVSFLAGQGNVACSGNGLDNCQLSVLDDRIQVTYTRTYDTLTNTLTISGLQVRSDSAVNPGVYDLLVTGGTAIQYGNQPADSVIHGRFRIFPTFQLAETPYDETFESGPASWIPEGTRTSWVWGNPTGTTITAAASGNNAWVTGLNTPYLPNESGSVSSPCFDFRGMENPLVALSIWSDNEDGFDGAVLQQSTDAGDTWTTVGNTDRGLNWYNAANIIANPGDQPVSSQLGWTGRDDNWKRARIGLDQVLNETTIRFRMAFGSIGSVDTLVSNDGFAFDDFFLGESNKKILIEHFTDESRMADINVLENLISGNKEEIIPIQFHISTGDGFFEASPAGPSVRALHYGISETGVAAVEGADFLGKVEDLTAGILERSILSESRMQIEIDTSQNTVSISSSVGIDQEVMVYVAVVENTGGYTHVFRAFLPDPAGTSYAGWQNGVTETLTVTWTADATPSPSIVDAYDSLKVIVFVQNQETKEIYQAAISPIWTSLLDPSILRKAQFQETTPKFSVYPNPVDDRLFVSLEVDSEVNPEVKISDITGRNLDFSLQKAGTYLYYLDMSSAPAGFYNLAIRLGEGVSYNKKIVVTHR